MLMHSLHRKLNKSPSTVDDPTVLKDPLTDPKLKKITLHFPLGLEVTARNLKGVTIKDALDAIYKQFKKRVRVFSPFSIAHIDSIICACKLRRLTRSYRQMTNSKSPT